MQLASLDYYRGDNAFACMQGLTLWTLLWSATDGGSNLWNFCENLFKAKLFMPDLDSAWKIDTMSTSKITDNLMVLEMDSLKKILAKFQLFFT